MVSSVRLGALNLSARAGIPAIPGNPWRSIGTKTLLPDIPRYHGDVQLIVAAHGCGEVVRADRWSFATLCRKRAEYPESISGQAHDPITIWQRPLDIEWLCEFTLWIARTLLADVEEPCRRSCFLRVSEDAAQLGGYGDLSDFTPSIATIDCRPESTRLSK